MQGILFEQKIIETGMGYLFTEEEGIGYKGCPVMVGDLVIITKPPDPEEDAYHRESVGLIGKVSSLRFENEDDFPNKPLIGLKIKNLNERLKRNRKKELYPYEFYPEEITVIRNSAKTGIQKTG